MLLAMEIHSNKPASPPTVEEPVLPDPVHSTIDVPVMKLVVHPAAI